MPTGDPGGGYGRGVQRMDLLCGSGSVPVRETDGGGPGFTSISVTSPDASRQVVFAANVYDIA